MLELKEKSSGFSGTFGTHSFIRRVQGDLIQARSGSLKTFKSSYLGLTFLLFSLGPYEDVLGQLVTINFCCLANYQIVWRGFLTSSPFKDTV